MLAHKQNIVTTVTTTLPHVAGTYNIYNHVHCNCMIHGLHRFANKTVPRTAISQKNLKVFLTLDTMVGLHCRLVKGSICWFFEF